MKRNLPTRITKLPEAKSNAAKARRDPTSAAELGFLLFDVSRLRRSAFDDYMKPLGMTRLQWFFMAHLGRQDGGIQAELANTLHLGKAAMGALIDRLEILKWIERRSGDKDRRVKRVYLTPKGIKIIVAMNVRSDEMNERMLDGLDIKARRALVDALNKAKENLLVMKNVSRVA